METQRSIPSGPEPRHGGTDPREGFGCFCVILASVIGGASAAMFQAAGPGGAPWAGLGACALSAMGLGIVYLGVRYHR